MYNVGIDIGSTAAKAVIMSEDKKEIIHKLLMPTGWSSKETADMILDWMNERGVNTENSCITATGYGRVSVPYANKVITEITCHGKGALFLNGGDCAIIDIGGQDTKIISIENGVVSNFLMNDKCSAGTGRFLEIMANTLGVTLSEIFNLAEQGEEISISSICTVFAESEVISLIGNGRSKNDIACGVVNSIANKVLNLCGKHNSKSEAYFLTGGFCDSEYMRRKLSQKLQKPVKTSQLARYAGAIGASLLT
ncbi:acyl-CoA dehydratase activase [Sedimentibacter sp.]|uniref:acyl-CoA dehydratase activase n=1 Tax=Sedimentibacter sp. TaxID=1960295 RepID=UPI0028A02ACE|nr:acyl-CoA dehydratase activase [Sedimentibacter sp.]